MATSNNNFDPTSLPGVVATQSSSAGASFDPASLPGVVAAPAQDQSNANSLGAFAQGALGVAKGAANMFLGPAESLGAHLGQFAAAGTAKIAGALGDTGLQNHIEQKLQQPVTMLTGGTVQPLKPGIGGLGQIAGDAAQNALYFAPGLGEVGGGFWSNLAKGALFGYGAGTAQNLSEGQSPTEAATPQASNLLGAFTGGTLNAIGPKIAGAFSQKGAVQGLTSNLESELNRTAPTRTLMQKMGAPATQRAINLIATVPEALPEVAGNNFNVNDAIDSLGARISQLGEARAEAIHAITPESGISLDELANNAKTAALTIPTDASPAEKAAIQQRLFSGQSQKMQSQIDSAIADIKTAIGKDTITAPELEALKESQAVNSKVFKYTGDIGDANGSSMLSTAAKTHIEKLAEEAGFPGMSEYNQYMQDHYNAIKLLQRLGKQTVKGGRLGSMLASHTVAAIGAMAANAAGGGFLGTLGGGLAGEGAGRMLSKITTDTSISNPLRDAILSRIEQEDPQIVKQLMQFTGRTAQVAPRLAPAINTLGTFAPNALTKAGTRAAVSATQ